MCMFSVGHGSILVWCVVCGIRFYPGLMCFSLICTDTMARGMDVDNVNCVLSYDSPRYLKTYIHRIGRTARAGKAGTAITLLEKKEVSPRTEPANST